MKNKKINNSFFEINIEEAFKILDTQKKGYISKKEFYNNISKLGTFSKKVIERTFRISDINHDGLISLKDLTEFVKTHDKLLRDLFDFLDIGKTGFITLDELSGSFRKFNYDIDKNSLKKLFDKFDINSDNKISFQEFVKYHHLFPVQNIRMFFDDFNNNAIDLGEFTIITQQNVSPFIPIFAGGVSSAVARTLTAPLDRIKITMQADTNFKGFLATIKNIKMNKEGFITFFKGNGTNCLKIIPEDSLRSLGYYFMIKYIVKNNKKKKPTFLQRILCGSVSGIFSLVAIYPLEITRTRLILSKKEKFKGIFDCIQKSVEKKGIKSLFKGLNTSILQIIPYAAINIGVYNTFKEYYALNLGRKPDTMGILCLGTISEITAQIFSFPFTLVRTKLQAQGYRDNVFYNGFLDCVKKVYQRGGFKGFYIGIIPSTIKSIPSACISYSMYEYFEKLMSGTS